MKKFDNMDDYEKEIAQHLIKLGYEDIKAIRLLENYYNVMQMIGWDRSPESWAEKLHVIHEAGILPQQWIEHIESFENVPIDPWKLK